MNFGAIEVNAESEKRTLVTLLDTPKLPPCRKAALQRELADVNAVLGKADKEHP